MGKQLEIDFETIKTKICTKCGVEKNVEEFGKYKRNNDGINSLCKECCKEKSKEWRKLNPEKAKEWRKLNQEKYKKYQKEYSKTEKRKEYEKEYYILNSEKSKKYRELNKEKRKKYIKEYSKEKPNEYIKKRIKIDELFKLKCNLRSIVLKSFKRNGFKKNSKTEQILGCSFEEFKLYLESKFEPWMNWYNRGNPKDGILELNKTWDIDHIIPLASAKTVEDVIRLNHYTNLQPLCSHTNRNIKRDK